MMVDVIFYSLLTIGFVWLFIGIILADGLGVFLGLFFLGIAFFMSVGVHREERQNAYKDECLSVPGQIVTKSHFEYECWDKASGRRIFLKSEMVQ